MDGLATKEHLLDHYQIALNHFRFVNARGQRAQSYHGHAISTQSQKGQCACMTILQNQHDDGRRAFMIMLSKTPSNDTQRYSETCQDSRAKYPPGGSRSYCASSLKSFLCTTIGKVSFTHTGTRESAFQRSVSWTAFFL